MDGGFFVALPRGSIRHDARGAGRTKRLAFGGEGGRVNPLSEGEEGMFPIHDIRKKMNKLPLTLFTALCCAMPLAQADEILDLTPIVRDFVAGGAKEIAVPYLRYNDTTVPADGVPDSVTVYFNVYTVGTTTKLFSSKAATVPVPALPCTQPDPNYIEDDMKVKFLGADPSTRVHFAITASLGCWDMADNQWKDAYKTVVYSTNAASANNAWVRAWNLDSIGANGADVAGDGTNELMLTLSVPTATGGEQARVVYLDGPTGTIVFDNNYPLSNGY